MNDADDGFQVATQADLQAFNAPPPQNTATPADADIASLDQTANAQAAAGVPQDQVEAQLMQGAQQAQTKRYGKVGKVTKAADDDGFETATVGDVWNAQAPPAQQPVMDQPSTDLATPQETPGIGATIASSLRGAGLQAARGITIASAEAQNVLDPFAPDEVKQAREDAAFKAADALRDYEKENEVSPVTKGEKAAAIVTNVLGGLGTMGMGGPEAAAQDVIAEGGTIKDAEKALAAGTAQQEAMVGVGNLGKTLPGRIGLQVPTNVALGAGTRALTGENVTDPYAVASDIGSGLAGAAIPSGEHETAEQKSARKVNEAADQLVKNTDVGQETPNANEVPQDQGGVSEAGTQQEGVGESGGENIQQPAQAGTAARDAGEQVADVDQSVQPNNAADNEGTPDVSAGAKDEGAPDAGEAGQKAFTPEERHAQKIEALLAETPNLTDEQKDYLRENIPAPQKDRVTGYHLAEQAEPTIEAAQDSGQPASYTSIDYKNMGALNHTLGSNEAANPHLRAIADIVDQTLGGDHVGVRVGGDELGQVKIGEDAATTHDKMLQAQQKINDYVQQNGLDNLTDKQGRQVGPLGIHFATTDIAPGQAPRDIMDRADAIVAQRKRGSNYEFGEQAEAAGIGSGAGERTGPRAADETQATGREVPGGEAAAPAESGEGAGGRAAESGAVNERAGEPSAVEPEESVANYRTGNAAEQGVTADEARNTIKQTFGSTAARKMEQAGLKITPSSELPKLSPELTPAQREGVKGLTTKAGQPHLIHDQTAAAEIPGTVVHEIWHANGDKVLPKTKQEALARAVDSVARTSPKVAEELSNIPANTPKGQLAGEKVARALQSVHMPGVTTKALDAIKIGLNRLGVPKNWLDANESLLRRIGSENLKHFQETPRTYQDAGTERTATPKPRVKAPSSVWDKQRAELGVNTPPQRVTSIKNAQVNQEREERNAPLLESIKGASDQKAMNDAKGVLDKDQDAGRRLTAELLAKPRPLNKTEVAVMLRDRVRIHNELEDAYNDAKDNPNNPAHVDKIKDLEMQRDANDEADRRAGTENALGLQARKMMAAQDYSLVNMVKRLQVAKGANLKPDEMAQVRKIADGIKAEKRVNNSPKEIADEFAALKNELAGISKKPEAKATDTQYARAEPRVADVIQRMAANRAAAGMPYEAAIKAIHEAVSPHADVGINDVRDAINEPKSQRRQGFLGKKESDLTRRLKENDLSKPGTRYKPVYNEATNAAEGRVNALQRRFDAMKRATEQRNQSRAYKVGATMHNTHLASILASLKVYPKLIGAVGARYAGHVLEQSTGAIAQHLPGLRGIASKAESQRVTLGGELQYLKGIGASAKEGLQTVRRGYSDIDAKYGGKDTVTDEYTDYADSLFGDMGQAAKEGRVLDAARQLTSGVARFEGRTHGAIKAFASTPKFYESYYNIAAKMRDDMEAQKIPKYQIEEYMSRRSTDLQIGSKAYLNALEDKMQGKNALADGINRMLVSWDNSGNAGLRGLSLAFQTAFPIRKIPVNIAKEGTSYLFGGLKAATSIAKNYAESRKNGTSFLDTLTGDRADYIMKNIKKQGAGAALFAMGYMLGPSVLGGAPQPGDSKKNLPVRPGEAEIGGTQISDSAFHSAVGQVLQLGAGYRRAYESYYGKSHDAVSSGLEAFADQYGSQLVRQVPYLDQPRRWAQTAEDAPRDKRSAISEIAGNQIRSMVVPGVVQQYARDTDPYQKYRKPKNILQDIETGIPGLREDVPTH